MLFVFNRLQLAYPVPSETPRAEPMWNFPEAIAEDFVLLGLSAPEFRKGICHPGRCLFPGGGACIGARGVGTRQWSRVP